MSKNPCLDGKKKWNLFCCTVQHKDSIRIFHQLKHVYDTCTCRCDFDGNQSHKKAMPSENAA